MGDKQTMGAVGSRFAVAAASMLALAVGSTRPVLAQDLNLNKSCRNSVGLELSRVVKTGMTSQDKCHTLANKVSVESDICNGVGTFPFSIIDGGKYDKSQNLTDVKLVSGPAPKCAAASTAETLDNYPSGQTSETYDNINEVLNTSAHFALGGKDLNGDKVAINCLKAISKARQNVTNAMLKAATSCQKTADTAATLADFHGLERTPTDCLVDTAPTVQSTKTAAQTLITAKCGTAPNLITGYPNGAAVGSCDTLPTCVTEAALANAKNLALSVYPAKDCGASATPAARTVAVTLSSPVQLGGVDVRVNYPKFQSGVPENGVDPAVQSAVVMTPGGAFVNANDKDGHTDVNLAFSPPFTSGALFQLKLDTCQPLAMSTCSVTTSQACTVASQCAQRCLQLSEGGTANSANSFCTLDSQCPASGPLPGLLQKCVCPTCAPKHCVGDNSACSVNADCTGPGEGGVCTQSEECVPRHDVCSVSQWQECGEPGDAACPPGEDCVTQSSRTTCTVLSALDEFANEVDGVTCSINVTEP